MKSLVSEFEGYGLLKEAGLQVPRHLFLSCSSLKDKNLKNQKDLFSSLKTPELVVKVMSSQITHKSEVQGVQFCRNNFQDIFDTLSEMNSRLMKQPLDEQSEGFLVCEKVSFSSMLGSEILLGYRESEDFGPLITLGVGGIYSEYLSSQFKIKPSTLIFPLQLWAFLDEKKSESGVAKDSKDHLEGDLNNNLADSLSEKSKDKLNNELRMVLESWVLTPLVSSGLRGQKERWSLNSLLMVLNRFASLCKTFPLRGIHEFEINPLVATSSGEGFVALDVLAFKQQVKEVDVLSEGVNRGRPLHKMKSLLEPKTVALVGVSETQNNPGRVILQNMLRSGYPKDKLFILKPPGSKQVESIEGVACYDSLSAISRNLTTDSLDSSQKIKLDLFVLAISASASTDLLEQLLSPELNLAESIIVIPGGFEEKQGQNSLVEKIQKSLAQIRKTSDQGPLLMGANCLGLLSNPGKVNTLFIPQEKLPLSQGQESPLALLSQSGAFAISRMNHLAHLRPRYVITCGNQMDLRISDYLNYLKKDPQVKVFAVYVEGFKPGDGEAFLKEAKEIIDSGRKVILYRAGRTPQGAQASASHTASVAGDYLVCKQLVERAGVHLTESLLDFENLIQMFVSEAEDGHIAKKNLKTPGPLVLAAISNAGFECVAVGDNLQEFTLPEFSLKTEERLQELFKKHNLHHLVDVHNPLDLTPMASSEVYAKGIEILLEDEKIEGLIVGCVPLTPTLETLPMEIKKGSQFVLRLIEIHKKFQAESKSYKRWVLVVDSGSLYDPFVEALQAEGISVFRYMDQAMKAFSLWAKNGKQKT